ncbi:CbiQ family ECF transporter T component [Bifidobacterium oedipodis]|uniref:CbiQ family ECF transporter T component n=1 Tax=Bifidobacterium oedipodis TaxID=2675322 RepID=UPI003AA8B582
MLRLEAGRVQADVPADRSDEASLSEGTTAQDSIAPVVASHAPHDSNAPQQPFAIVADHLAYGYQNDRQPVFTDVCLRIRQGETVALMGANGSGKSTLARLLCALARPAAGSIMVAGLPIAPAKPKRKQLTELRKRVGYVMQHPERQLFADTVADDVAYGPRNQGLSDDEVDQRVGEALRLLHIEHLADRSPFELSGGQQRLAAIAGIVASKPQVLVMDEPTASLDAAARSRIHDLVRALRAQGVTMLIITHDRAEAAMLADRVLDMNQLCRSNAASPSDSETTETTETTSVSAAKQHHSLLQRLDPRVKMVGFLIVMFSMFAVSNPMQLAAAALLTLAAILAARMNPLEVARTVHPILAMLVLMGLLNLFVVRTGTPLVELGPISITDDAVRFAILYTCRFALVIIQGALFLTTTGPTAITDAFASLLSPLGRLGLHTQELSLVMSLALRFIPTLTDEALAIRNAQAARGGSIETGSPSQKLRAMAAIIVPVLAGTMRHADNLALALDARCYEEGIHRTHWRQLAIRSHDIACIACVCGWLVVLVTL